MRIAEPGERPPFQVTILSPHRDDAAFSCGLLLSRCAELGVPVRIVNVFTRSAYAPYLAGGAGADEVETVSAARLAEDRALVERMGAGCRMDDVGLTDAPVRLGLPVDRVMAEPLTPEQMRTEAATLAGLLRARLDGRDDTLVLAPMALGGHVDHALVRDAARLLAPADRLALYEDLPYVARLTEAERAAQGRAALRAEDPGEAPLTELIVVAAGERGGGGVLKRELASLYPSQIEAAVADEMARYAEQVGGERLYACGHSAARGLRWLGSERSDERQKGARSVAAAGREETGA